MQVASVPWIEFCRLWKDYMVVLAECLVEATGDVASPIGQRLAHLVYETGAAWMMLGLNLLWVRATISQRLRARLRRVWVAMLCRRQCHGDAHVDLSPCCRRLY